MKRVITLIVGSAFIIQSCIDPTIETSIDPYLISYLETFYKEGIDRGIDLTNKSLIMKFDNTQSVVDLQHPGVSIPGKRQHAVYFNNSLKEYSFDKREIIIFHELGHALLNLKHSSNPDAIMFEKPNLNINMSDSVTRKQKLDELFGV